MKKISVLFSMIALALASQAQSYDEIKAKAQLGQYKPAKEDLDKRMSNAKFASKPEAFILKATIYGVLGGDSATVAAGQGAPLTAEAEAAFAKYKEMDPSMALVADPFYKNALISIYSNNFTVGYDQYKAEKWEPAYGTFTKVVNYSDMLLAAKILTATVDTNTLILAAYTAENAKHPDDAAKYYGRLADAKVSGAGYEGAYRFLVTYYFNKKDIPNFEKYKEIGKGLYPNSEFFTYDKTDFAVGLESGFDAKMKSLDQVLASDPGNFKANLSLGQIIYDTLYSEKEGHVYPSNAAELETKMIAAFQKASETVPDTTLAFLFLGDAYMNKSIKAGEAKDAFVAEMKKRTPAGKGASKEDIAKRAEFEKTYGAAMEGAIAPYTAAAAIYAKKAATRALTGTEKQQYKKAAGYLGDIYTYKKERARGNAADVDKYTAAEKKWNDIYVSIK